MDLFTHVVFAYLLSFVVWGPGAPQFIAAGALAGGLPDGDALLFPLTRRFPILRHHGITHSILGVTIVAAVGCVLVPYLPFFTHASPLGYFVAMEIGGLSHVFLDGFTHFAVLPLLPFSLRRLRLDADVAINVAMLSLTAVTLGTLIAERGHVPLSVWVETTWILAAIYGGYLLLRGVARWRAGVVRRRERFSAVAPTSNPRVWTLLDQEDTPARYRLRFRRYRFGEKAPEPETSFEVAKVPPSPGPVGSEREALERTYLAAMEHNPWMAMRAHVGVAFVRGDCYEVLWYIVEVAGLGRTFGVRGRIDRSTGAMELHSGVIRRPPGATT
ncbi:MAG TPA: metal-dependent hydrolase [Thermoplasmata archaeon]|nr:metal-dependent hydrolase [Thermoplasmata archaeon]